MPEKLSEFVDSWHHWMGEDTAPVDHQQEYLVYMRGICSLREHCQIWIERDADGYATNMTLVTLAQWLKESAAQAGCDGYVLRAIAARWGIMVV